MIRHDDISDGVLRAMIADRRIGFAGHAPTKIYGRLSCAAGKRMRRDRRVFFSNESEALANGFRPCSRCMRPAYLVWKEAHCSA